MQTTVGLVGGTLALSLALWCLFWVQQMPLDPAGTSVVVVLSGALIVGVRRLGMAVQRRRARAETPKADS